MNPIQYDKYVAEAEGNSVWRKYYIMSWWWVVAGICAVIHRNIFYEWTWSHCLSLIVQP